jgi:predicted TIM-barrel fold metal-dependent hydrolase
MSHAANEWLVNEWLLPEKRLRASLVVPYEDGELAAAEIHRMGDQPGFIQVMLVIRTAEPLGRRKYWKMYQAAVEHDLPIGIHFGGAGGGPITGTGWPSFYVEDHAGMPTSFEAQVISLVCEGVFEEFPDLKVVMIEGGFAWVPSLAWRLDAAWKKLKAEVPRLKKLPSEYIHDHIWLTTQPMEEPARPEQFQELLDSFQLADRLMFSTDYPHWDFDAPDQALPKIKLDEGVSEAIMAENARTLYRL